MVQLDSFSYLELHKMVRRNKPAPELCEKCGLVKHNVVHNISGDYIYDYKNDWVYLCYRCHYWEHHK